MEEMVKKNRRVVILKQDSRVICYHLTFLLKLYKVCVKSLASKFSPQFQRFQGCNTCARFIENNNLKQQLICCSDNSCLKTSFQIYLFFLGSAIFIFALNPSLIPRCRKKFLSLFCISPPFFIYGRGAKQVLMNCNQQGAKKKCFRTCTLSFIFENCYFSQLYQPSIHSSETIYVSWACSNKISKSITTSCH